MAVFNMVAGSSGGGSLIANWDFTQSLVDSVNGLTATLSGSGITQTSDGVSITTDSDRITLPYVLKAYARTYEVDFGDMSLGGSSSSHHRLFMPTNENGFIYRSTGKWAVYNGSGWTETSQTAYDYFANSTLKIMIGLDLKMYIYKDNTLVSNQATFELFGSSSSNALQIGASSQSCPSVVVKGFRAYA